MNTSQQVYFAGRALNLTEISSKVGCSLSHLSRIISGARKPSLHLIKLLSLELGMSIDDFVANLPL